MPERLLLPEYQDGPQCPVTIDMEPEEVPQARMLPEIDQWCLETFGRIPRIDWMDGTDYDRASNWIIWFAGDAEVIAFKMKWTDYKRD